ncbi:MAG: cytochrome c maturation protein CcmE [Geopsychrobacter sp.]|nr:cytochrome c maturation protein CcmE [Geopsychrobacter sp.]
MKKSNRKALIAILVMVFGVGFLIFRGLSSTSVYYMTVAELKTSEIGRQLTANQSVRIGGLVVDGGTDYNQRELVLRFSLKDESDPQQTINAIYQGAKPDAFEPDIETLLEGTYNREKNLFLAETLLVKCPSKYESDLNNKQEDAK